jgi:hypothetical protein
MHRPTLLVTGGRQRRVGAVKPDPLVKLQGEMVKLQDNHAQQLAFLQEQLKVQQRLPELLFHLASAHDDYRDRVVQHRTSEPDAVERALEQMALQYGAELFALAQSWRNDRGDLETTLKSDATVQEPAVLKLEGLAHTWLHQVESNHLSPLSKTLVSKRLFCAIQLLSSHPELGELHALIRRALVHPAMMSI